MNRSPRDLMERELIRTRILLLAMLLSFGGLAGALWRIQVARGEDFQSDLDQQSIRRVRIPGLRGQIAARDGTVLADNRPSYCLAIYLEELRLIKGGQPTKEKVIDLIERLTPVIGRPPEVDDEDIQIHINRRLPLPLFVWRDLDEGAMARFAEQAAHLPGADTFVDAVRVYPLRSTAGHVVGYVGRTNMVQHAERPYHYYNMEMIGRSGVEKSYDEVLRGQEGGRLMRVDVAGYRFEDLAHRDPLGGSDVRLAIDINVQRAAEAAMQDVEGAIAVVDPRNGDVLALVSSPGLDGNVFVPFITAEAWQAVRDHPGHPLVNRASSGAYTPGSVFKPVVALAALENNLVDPARTVHCPGYYILGNRRSNCWLSSGHGDMNLRDAIQDSCNVYFFTVSREMGCEYIAHMARALGLGRSTDIGLSADRPGLVPDPAWKRNHLGESWFEGDTCNLSIGQGPITVTPLQMALVVAAIANGGVLHAPRLILGIRDPGREGYLPVPPRVSNRLNWSPRSLDIVRGAMRDVVMSPRGGGRLARVPGTEMAGKTGTAEYGPKALNKKRGWMIAFAPYRQPRYAVACVVDDAEGGGVDAAPRVRRLLSELFDKPSVPAAETNRG